MKIVKNACYGGFGISLEASKRYCDKKGLQFTDDFYAREIPRDDKALIAIVEEMGAGVNSRFSELVVVEIPDGIEWEIDDYDGMEIIREKHRSW